MDEASGAVVIAPQVITTVVRQVAESIGDNLNDLEMLEFAGRPVVMGNALDELKTRGWPLTTTNDEAGVARAIETFILGPAS